MAIWLYGKKNKKLTIKDIKENIRKNLYELICLIWLLAKWLYFEHKLIK